MLDDTRTRAREQLRTEAERQSEVVREELGETILDLVEEYFPEQTKARRQENLGGVFVAGVVVGLVVSYLLRRLLGR